MHQLSVVIITCNEEKNLGRCLESVRNIADEIVVVDSDSTDKTVEIARGKGARVVNQAFMGYGQQKNFAANQASNAWVLSLDADEVVTPELEKSIQEVKQHAKYSVYEVPRLTNYCGKWIRHSGWYPDRQTRLFNRTMGQWEERQVHEFWKLNSPGTKGILKGDLLHYSFATIDEHLVKMQRYAELGARDAVARGKRVSVAKMALYPTWKFVVDYMFRLGFLDGFYGFAVCKLTAQAAFIKYLKTRIYTLEADKIQK